MIFVLFTCSYLLVDARWWGWWWNSGWWDAIWGVIALLIYAIYEIRRRKMIKKAKADLEKALFWDSTWDLKELEKITKEIFKKYQKARQDKDLTQISDLITKSYIEKATKIMNKKLKWKKNILKDINIHNLTLMSVRDFPWRDWDMFAMEVDASMIDYTLDEKTWNFLNSTLTKWKYESTIDYEKRAKKEWENFKEYYIFIRYNWKWLLNNIKQKFSILWDIIKLRESDLIKVLVKEKENDDVNDDVFYTKWD